jgi:RNA polymerase sigma-70 factor (ECF subfamily)
MMQKTLTQIVGEQETNNLVNGSSAEAALYEKYSRRVYYLALSELRSPEDAEDVRTETFLRVIKAMREGKIRSLESLPSFIVGTTLNVIRERVRNKYKTAQIANQMSERARTHSLDDFFLDPVVKRAIEQLIQRMKPREQSFLRMYYYEELPPEEIARRLGLKPERLRLMKSRTLKRFREIYDRLVGR